MDYHRKSAARALGEGSDSARSGKRGRPATYGVEVREALRVIGETSDRLCGKRLAPFVPELTDRLTEHGELVVSEELRGQSCKVSASA